jgi:hypothetical protein
MTAEELADAVCGALGLILDDAELEANLRDSVLDVFRHGERSGVLKERRRVVAFGGAIGIIHADEIQRGEHDTTDTADLLTCEDCT